MPILFYIFIVSALSVAGLILRKLIEIKKERLSRVTEILNRSDALVFHYARTLLKKIEYARSLIHVGAFLHGMTVSLVWLSNLYQKTKRFLVLRTHPYFLKLRAKKEFSKDPASLYVRDMLEYKSGLSRE